MKVQRYDKSLITDQDITETKEGYLTVRAPVTKPGVFPYMRADGEMTMEAKLPSELFADSTIQSVNAKPVTDDHPNEPVTSENFQQYSKGMTHTDSAVKDNMLFVSFTITDSATIDKVKKGKRELSLGFEADVKPEIGTYEGMQYDSVQTNMLINHLAIVDKGRVGPDASIRGDSIAFMVDSVDVEPNKQGGSKNMTKLKIDSKEYEVDSAVKSRMDALEAQLEAANIKAGNVDKLEGERDALQTQLDDKTQELSDEKEKAITADKLDAAVEARTDLITSAKVFLGDSFEFKGKTDTQIKLDAISSIKEDFKAEGKSDDYINAFYDALTVQAEAKGFTADAAFNGGNVKSKEKEATEEIEKKKAARLNLNQKGDKQK
ncbi:DUF2213 domain-containing protein [Listeria monocytogenes]|uniref:DUF2213 domain-containing protein n=1 Tax=Listeria monocytogenes TaxID=1639 RepID=UPI0010B9C6D3|nr:DUF2213 domain-containing protein [Listeria monocytogenes]MBC2089533.1 DUF2213 domain-containing protein [Listeria welshimeri]EAE0558696.1 DUF2213 domain-containing protein [Listeria monocytogenes]EAE1082196.1 DUF2213 domain-containing protein [Listeria monocytogenes]EAE1094404.1 DUF2213 domain-containing protein [Listeria monocytogenes]EAE1125789.1 DUF2213 domain-containing protein [Listeria monocytogenes]